MSELPAGWVEVRTDEAGVLDLGRQRSPKYHSGPNMKPYLRVANVFEDRIDASDVKTMHFEPEAFERSRLHPGDVLLNEGQSPEFLGRPAIYRGEPPDVAFTNSLIRFRPSGAVTSEWALAVFRHHMHAGRFARESRITTNIAHLSANRLAAVEFRVPPLPEQLRIVAAIEEAFSKLDAGEAGLRTVRQLLKRMREAVLTAAVTGRLVPQDHTDTRASNVLADLGVELWGGEVLPPGWAAAPVEQLALLVTDGDHRPPKRVASGVPHLTAKNVRGGRFDLTACSYVDDAGFAQTRSRYEPLAGDVIVTCVGTIGRVAVVPRGLEFSADRNLAAVRFKPAVDARFARIVFESPRIQKLMAEASGSTAQPHLYLRDLRSIVLPVPPEEEQLRVIAEVDRLLSFIEVCERAVAKGLSRSAALRRSVLKAAFEGRLVPQDRSDEPASVLLERTRADRAGVDGVTVGRRRKQVGTS